MNVSSMAQSSKVLKDLTGYKLQYSGTLMDSENDVDGYYYFYEVGKLKKGQKEFMLILLDKNLNEVARKSHVDQKNIVLLDGAFNGQQISLAFYNRKSEKIKLVSFDRKGKKTKSKYFPYSKKMYNTHAKYVQRRIADKFKLTPVDHKGFVFSYPMYSGSRPGYKIRFVPTNGGKPWTYGSKKDFRGVQQFTPLGNNDKIYAFYELKKPKLMGKKFSMLVRVVEIETGKVILKKEITKHNIPELITNATFDENNFYLFGEYFPKGKNMMKAKSLGLFFEKYTYDGKKISRKNIDWSQGLMKNFQAQNDESGKNYIFFHEMIQTDNGDYYAVGEQYRKTASAMGIMSAAMGNQSSVTQITISDIFFFKFDKEFNFKGIEKFQKSKTRIPSISDFASPQLNALVINKFGGFDYNYTQRDVKNDRFYTYFIDYEKGKKKKGKSKSVIKVIYNKDGQLKEEKIYLDKKYIKERPKPGKFGHVLLYSYDKKKKEADLRLEKINAE